MINAGIIGATGYTGVELVRLLKNHPKVNLAVLTSQSYEGQEIAEIYPSVQGQSAKKLRETSASMKMDGLDVVFLALPHGHSVDIAQKALAKGVKVIDLGADFRFRDAALYEKWYKVKHSAPDTCRDAVYGLVEINKEAIKKADIIGNPGCYPTASLLALAPLMTNGLAVTDSIIIDAKSGVSGAGRQLALTSHFSEVNENINAYGVTSHRHMPEIEQELSSMAGENVNITFTPHLVPMTRGILSTVYLKLHKDLSEEELRRLYQDFYQESYFVRLLPKGQWPHTKWVYGSNYCHLNLAWDQRTGRLIILSAIDNLVKGASGQAVQNLNILFGFPEKTGLDFPAVYP